MKIFFTVFGFCLLMAGCRSQRLSSSGEPLVQGITGEVREKTGNQMPSPDAPASKGKALKTTVYIYEATHISQTERLNTSPFYSAIRSRLVQKVETDKKGRFAVALPPGTYSLFTKVGAHYFANRFDQNNTIAPAVVTANQLTEVSITVNAAASY